MNTRAELRYEMETITGRLDTRWIHAASRLLSANLEILTEEIGHEFPVILGWLPRFPGEPDGTRYLAYQASRREIFLPRVMADQSLEFIRLDSGWDGESDGLEDSLVQSGEERLSVEQSKKAMILIPGLAYDHEGIRLGRRAGLYKEFLLHGGLRPAVKVGVCWELQVVNQVPAGSELITVDWVCHERGFFPTGR